MTDAIKAFPRYPSKHTGVALVVGAAPVALEEVHLAKSRLSAPPYIVAVNGMVSRVPCQAMVTGHPNLLDVYFNWKTLDPRPIIHFYPSDQRILPARLQGIDYIWAGPPAVSGTSALGAALAVKAMGFEEVILCGVPLSKTGHVEGYPKAGSSEFNNRPIGKVMNGTVLQRRETWSKFHKAGKLIGVTSFSGFTRELLGEPRFQKEISDAVFTDNK